MHLATNSGADKSRDVIKKIECRMQYRRGSCELRGRLEDEGTAQDTARLHASPPCLEKKEINENIYTRKRDTEVKT
jgi:hypothetical protein